MLLLVRALLVCLCSCCFWAGSALAQSRLVNGGFESVAGGLPTGWAFEEVVRGKGSVKVLEPMPGAPGAVLEMRPNGRNGGDRPLAIGQLLDPKDLRGKRILVSASLGAEGGADAVFAVTALGKDGELGSVRFFEQGNAQALRVQSGTLVVPPATQHIVVYAAAGGTAGRALFGGLSVVIDGDGRSAPAAAAAAALPAGATVSASITVDTQRVVRQIPSALFGANLEWVWDGQGLWSASRKAIDPDAIRLARELGPTLLRWPGGGFSDTYNWRDGIGPQDRRPTTPHHPRGPESRHSFGTDEAAEFSKAIGADLMITVNVGSGTARMAAEWVNYMNKGKGPRVQLWEIGNEVYMADDFSGGHMSADAYGTRFLEYAAAMRAVDPTIRLGGIGGLNYGPYAFIADRRWSEKVLSKAAGEMDFFAVHNAYAPVVMGVSKSVDPRAVYAAMLAAPVLIENNLRDVSALLARYEKPTRPISIAITEWGPFFHALPDNEWVDHPKTMGSALFVSSTFNVFLRNPRVEIANFFKLNDNGFMGWLGRRGPQWVHTAPGQVFMMYRRKLGRSLVQTDVQGPSFSTSGLGVVGSVNNAPMVDAVATLDDGRLTLLLTNKSEKDTIEGRITLKGVSGWRSGRVEALHADSYDSHTGSQLPNIPGLRWAKQVDLGRHGKGAPEEIGLASETLPASTKGTLSYRLRPLSVTAITLEQVRR